MFSRSSVTVQRVTKHCHLALNKGIRMRLHIRCLTILLLAVLAGAAITGIPTNELLPGSAICLMSFQNKSSERVIKMSSKTQELTGQSMVKVILEGFVLTPCNSGIPMPPTISLPISGDRTGDSGQLCSSTPPPSSTPVAPSCNGAGERCPSLYENLPGVGCYKYVLYPQTWEQCRKDCESEGAQLAVPESEDELNFLQQLSRRNGEYPWLGFKKLSGQWKTVYDLPIRDLQFQLYWGQNQPSGAGNCARIDGGYLRDSNCADPRTYICEHIFI